MNQKQVASKSAADCTPGNASWSVKTSLVSQCTSARASPRWPRPVKCSFPRPFETWWPDQD
jgi:hypothetical protein